MRERPILFSGPMVRAILEKRKTQTRRVFKGVGWEATCPYGAIGDRLWVKETHCPDWFEVGSTLYRADLTPQNFACEEPTWTPSIFMPRKLSRITLEITDVRVQQLREISEEDAQAEGVAFTKYVYAHTARFHFKELWDSINAKRGFGWDTNPFVWAITFKEAHE